MDDWLKIWLFLFLRLPLRADVWLSKMLSNYIEVLFTWVKSIWIMSSTVLVRPPVALSLDREIIWLPRPFAIKCSTVKSADPTILSLLWQATLMESNNGESMGISMVLFQLLYSCVINCAYVCNLRSLYATSINASMACTSSNLLLTTLKCRIPLLFLDNFFPLDFISWDLSYK